MGMACHSPLCPSTTWIKLPLASHSSEASFLLSSDPVLFLSSFPDNSLLPYPFYSLAFPNVAVPPKLLKGKGCAGLVLSGVRSVRPERSL